ncbi:DUF397 domain-containing protein [Streptomyces lavendulocolor]|uniref:DUF397 domain-containing protein n=1 Tax=Streptomyces lavendulocolor TaxID=67316 RepID=A0ABV2WGG0_9ACTN
MTTLSATPTAAELAAAPWRTSSYSAANNECVEVALVTGGTWVGVRDTKDRARPALTVPGPAWAALVGAVSAGAL